tara:strand:+ start:150 stop:452 length:303 start_codon:yes stop_codon:yes gene_type:complete
MSNFKHDSGLESDTKSSQEVQEESDRLMKEFLNKGGKIEKIKSIEVEYLGTPYPDLKSYKPNTYHDPKYNNKSMTAQEEDVNAGIERNTDGSVKSEVIND